MSTTISSYRSSNSRRLRQIATRSQENTNDGDAESTDKIDNLNRARMDEYSSPQESTPDTSSFSPASPTTSNREKQSSYSDLPVMMFFQHLFERFFTKRRRGRKRGGATRKMKSNGYQTRDEEEKPQGAGTRNLSSLSSIPTNEHEMFSMLHSKARSKKPPRLPGESGGGQSTIRRRNIQASRGKRTHVRSMTPPMIIITDRRTDEHQILFS